MEYHIGDKRIKLIELFAGIGAQVRALDRVTKNYDIHAVIDNDKYAIASYNAINNTDFKPQDITQLHGENLNIEDNTKDCYIMTYSFPCQALSLSGKQLGMDEGSGTSSSLLWEVRRILQELSAEGKQHLPNVLIMENVTQVHNDKNLHNFLKWLDFLRSLGYSNYYQDLNARDFNVPQNRKRTIMVSILGEYEYTFPLTTPLVKKMTDILETEVDEKYYIKTESATKLVNQLLEKTQNEVDTLQGSVIDDLFVSRAPRIYNSYAPTLRLNCNEFKVVSIRGRKDSSTPKVLGKSDYEQKLEISKNDWLNTLTTVNKDNLILIKHKNEEGAEQEYSALLRNLTPLEAWRFMDFSEEDYRKAEAVCSNRQLYRQAGNSIVVSMLEAVFKQLM